MFLELLDAGFLETQSVDQLLCTNCDRFLADRFVEGTCPLLGCGYEDARGDQCDGCGKLVNAIELIRPRCKICSSAPVIRQSNQFFINLPLVCAVQSEERQNLLKKYFYLFFNRLNQNFEVGWMVWKNSGRITLV